MRIFAGLWMLGACSALVACGGSVSVEDDGEPDPTTQDIGNPCVGSDESSVHFSGHRLEETTISSDDPDCGSGLCVLYNFQGRVSCPYGQELDALEPVPDAERCRIPGSSGPEGLVLVSVEPQCKERQPAQAAHCSCRCAGPDPDASYCTCPADMDCVEIRPNLGLGHDELVGSYCVTKAPEIEPHECDPCDLDALDCGPVEGPVDGP